MGRRRRGLLSLGLAGCAAACFSGADALGLPCEQDADCGNGQSCIDQFCGGPPATTGSTGPGDTTSGDTTAGTSDTAAGSSDESSTGITPGCGNGIKEAGEDCDEGSDTETCNADCTVPACGDGYFNPAFEECDLETGTYDSTCTRSCESVLFFDDFVEDTNAGNTWAVARPMIGASGLDDPDTEWMLDGDEWHTGDYSCVSGVVDLTSPPFSLEPAPKGQHIELQFSHRYLFDPDDSTMCAGIDNNDGGIVYVVVDGTETKLQGIYNNSSFGDTAGCAIDNPVGQGGGYVGASPGSGNVVETASLETFEAAGAMGQIRYRMSYDCGNCSYGCATDTPPPELRWTLDDVLVDYVDD